MRRMRRVGAVVAFAIVMVAMAVGLGIAQSHQRRALEHRFRDRITLAAGFVESYIADLHTHENQVARAHLAGPSPSEDDFARATEALGFEAALLLDADGHALRALPSDANIIGTDVASRPPYEHLRRAVAGRYAVSEVVPSAVRHVPVIAFALPFDTPFGRRVFSGAFDAATGPVGEYLMRSVPVPGHELYLVDSHGSIAATSRDVTRTSTLPELRPELWHATQTTSVGHVQLDGRSFVGVSRPVRGTRLRVIGAAPADSVTGPVLGPGRVGPWVLLVLLAILGAIALALLFRLVDSRAALREANADLDVLSRVDRLTGLYNRRHLEEMLDRFVHAARRSGLPTAVLLLDVDHFKAVNDRLGHDQGDLVLRAVADRIRAATRVEDVAGRWGGEEFVVLLPVATTRAARHQAERLRADIEATPVQLAGEALRVTVSVGCAAAIPADPMALVSDADDALYRAKDAGRNRVASAGPAIDCPACHAHVPLSEVRLQFAGAERRVECPACGTALPMAVLETAGAANSPELRAATGN